MHPLSPAPGQTTPTTQPLGQHSLPNMVKMVLKSFKSKSSWLQETNRKKKSQENHHKENDEMVRSTGPISSPIPAYHVSHTSHETSSGNSRLGDRL